MDRDQDVEVELYEENVGNLNYSIPTGSRSSSPDRFLPVLSSQEPTQRRLEENPFVAIDPRPDPKELSHAPTSQVPRIHDSCHKFRGSIDGTFYNFSVTRIVRMICAKKTVKSCLNLSKLRPNYYRSFFSGHGVYQLHFATKAGATWTRQKHRPILIVDNL